MALCLTAYSGLLIWQGRALFWYISNVTFLFGMLLAQYERQLLKAAGFLYPLQLLALASECILSSKRNWQAIP